MKLINQLFIGVALLASVTSVQATTIDLGTLPSGYTQFVNHPEAASFLDTINFTLLGSSNTDYGVGALNFSIGTVKYWNINDLSLKLFDSANTLLGSGLDFSVASLAAGNYHLEVAGIANGMDEGLYSGGINVTPVPEADTYAMMLAGLGLMGFVARRRSTN